MQLRVVGCALAFALASLARTAHGGTTDAFVTQERAGHACAFSAGMKAASMQLWQLVQQAADEVAASSRTVEEVRALFETLKREGGTEARVEAALGEAEGVLATMKSKLKDESGKAPSVATRLARAAGSINSAIEMLASYRYAGGGTSDNAYCISKNPDGTTAEPTGAANIAQALKFSDFKQCGDAPENWEVGPGLADLAKTKGVVSLYDHSTGSVQAISADAASCNLFSTHGTASNGNVLFSSQPSNLGEMNLGGIWKAKATASYGMTVKVEESEKTAGPLGALRGEYEALRSALTGSRVDSVKALAQKIHKLLAQKGGGAGQDGTETRFAEEDNATTALLTAMDKNTKAQQAAKRRQQGKGQAQETPSHRAPKDAEEQACLDTKGHWDTDTKTCSIAKREDMATTSAATWTRMHHLLAAQLGRSVAGHA
ncbi:hypothetical protein ERJ75_000337600 [Trypanosoma vivax]|uniref:Trypanosome variant surface glycoprotein A-type N-terminal domain-containing protein n=1 Tax=Trypanosoma vivax (strain Y486) TaxID=1055687 RepID=F9WN25_TRYVY|nr:hypothetical protein ERJ75_000337600 [Trypanosoma vivax]CCD18939.1 hypothetical protein, conserved in T. vivax [Trypanosoma vivax Y486]|eukprot:CCD18939.1 hypothetical protein, conserved in T. vivax [Trypanosoma vivax Y486]